MSKCETCIYFKILEGPLRGPEGVYEAGRAMCKKYGYTKDFTHKGAFKYLKCPDEEGDK